jgi:hypothetical protein
VQETLQAGRKFFTAATEPGMKDFAPNQLVVLQAASGDLAGALRMTHDPKLFKEPRPANSSNFRHSALFSIVQQIRAGDREVARLVLEEALRTVAEDHDPLPWRGMAIKNERLQEIALAQARIGLFNEALKSTGMIDSETIPGHLADARKADFLDEQRWKKAMTLADISLEQSKAGDQAGTWRSVKEAGRIVEAIKGQQYKYPIWKVAEALARIGKVAAARQVADTLEPDNRIKVYRLIAATRHDAGDDAGARTTLEAAADFVRQRLDDAKVGIHDPESPEGRRASHLLESLGHLQAKLGDRKQAIGTVRRINDSTRRLAALKGVASDLASAGDLEGALEAVGEMNSPESETEALEMVVSAFSRRQTAPPAR